jgi:hypothetical protein
MLESRSGNFVKGPYNKLCAIDLLRRTEVLEDRTTFMMLHEIRNNLTYSAALIRTSGPVLEGVNQIIYRNDFHANQLTGGKGLPKELEETSFVLEDGESIYIEDELFDTYAEGVLYGAIIVRALYNRGSLRFYQPLAKRIVEDFCAHLKTAGGKQNLSKLSSYYGLTPKEISFSEDGDYKMLAKNTLARLIAKGFIFRIDSQFDGENGDRGEYIDNCGFLNPAYIPTDLALKRLTPESLCVVNFKDLSSTEQKEGE